MRLAVMGIVAFCLLLAPGLYPGAGPLAMAQAAETGRWRHAISLTGEPKYPATFVQPVYVNASAPKGGRIRLGTLGTFDNFNPFISGVKGNLAAYLLNIYEPLLWPTLDEPTTEYGLIAEAVAFPDDYSSASFRLRQQARWHDGKPITADDVIFSFLTWKRLSPQFNRLFLKVSGVRKVSEREVMFSFSEKGDASLPLYIGQMSILPKHWWEGMDAQGRKRDVGTTTQEPPLGSGPYRLKAFVPGRSIVYERVTDYWGSKLPVRIGTENFDILEIEYFRDASVLFEAFKADQIDVRRELSLKSWVVGYDFTAANDGRVIKDAYPIERLGIAKSFIFNQRRDKFADVRVRKALALAYSFDDMNRQVFHNMLSRPGSYFPTTDFEARGPLSAGEKAILVATPDAPAESLLASVTQETPRLSHRANLFQALNLLKQAGYRLKDGRLVDARDQVLQIEFVLEDVAMERVAASYADSLEKLGISTAVRVIDDVQYQNRLRTFDFDIVVHAWVQGHAPGNEQREYWGSASAEKRGTNNLAGLKKPVIDSLVERLVLANDRGEKIAAGRLLDRVLRADYLSVLISVEDKEYVARWDRFGQPNRLPQYGGAAFPALWWWDAAKAAKTGTR
jgi:microcin C transport system substrate-binding protein